MTININEKEITLKRTFRSMMMFENIMERGFKQDSITDILVYLYCVVLASDEDIDLEYDKFIDWLDENPTTLNEFSKWVVKTDKVQSKIKKK